MGGIRFEDDESYIRGIMRFTKKFHWTCYKCGNNFSLTICQTKKIERK